MPDTRDELVELHNRGLISEDELVAALTNADPVEATREPTRFESFLGLGEAPLDETFAEGLVRGFKQAGPVAARRTFTTRPVHSCKDRQIQKMGYQRSKGDNVEERTYITKIQKTF